MSVNVNHGYASRKLNAIEGFQNMFHVNSNYSDVDAIDSMMPECKRNQK